MPELPEVETVRRSLERAVRGQRLAGIEMGPKRLRHPLPRRALEGLVGWRLVALRRRAKVLLLDFEDTATKGRSDDSLTALVHLGMSGRMLAREGTPPPERHEHVRFHFEQRLVSFVDPRRFGSVELAPTARLDQHARIQGLGPEPLSRAFDGAYLHRVSRGRKLALRNFLLDARIVAGLGNIYANETCFHAGLRPGRAAGRLTRAEAERLVEAAKGVLTRAIASGGTTLADGGYVDGEGQSGWFQVQLAVYGRDAEACTRCGTTIRGRMLGQRSAFYCPSCQR